MRRHLLNTSPLLTRGVNVHLVHGEKVGELTFGSQEPVQMSGGCAGLPGILTSEDRDRESQEQVG